MHLSNNKKMKISSENKFSAFDFNEADEFVEKFNMKQLSKFNFKKTKKSTFNSPVHKYRFLESFAGKEEFEKTNSVFEPIDVDASDSKLEEPTCREDSSGACNVSSDAKSGTKTAQNFNSDVQFSVEHIGARSAERITPWDANVVSGLSTDVSRAKRAEDTTRDYKNSNIDLNMFVLDTEPINVDSDDDCSVENKLLVSNSKFPECEGLLGDDPSGVEAQLTDEEMSLSYSPDFIYYGDICSMEATLIFSSQGIRLEASTCFGSTRSIEVEWAVSEIVSIRSIRWGDLAEITLLFKSNDTKIADAGITKIHFAVSDHNWAQVEETIKSLHSRYKICWNVGLDSYLPSKEGSTSLSSSQISNHCPAKVSNRFIVYPKGDPDAVSISERDIELLLPERFINDTIIDFYIKYIANKIRPPERQRFHFFNSFFFRKLAGLDKDSLSVHKGTISFQHVRKWTKKVDLFTKDFIFIPVNFSLHWSLIIICYPGEVAKSIDELQTSNKLPCILHLDSIRGSHKGFGDLFQNYLLEEWKERHDIEADNISEKFRRLQFFSLELPQQQNFSDCGLFLLHYVELFLEMTSVHSNNFTLAEPSDFPQKNWFPPTAASEKRVRIRKLIHGIFESDPLEDYVLEADDNDSSSDFTGGNISTGSSLNKNDERELALGTVSEFISDQGVPITSRKATPLKIPCCSGISSCVFDVDRQEALVVTDKFCELSTIEEESEVEGKMSPWTEEVQSQQSVKLLDLFSVPQHVANSVEHSNIQECEMLESSPETSTCLFPESKYVVIDEDYVPPIVVAPSDLELESYVIEDSDVEDNNVIEDS